MWRCCSYSSGALQNLSCQLTISNQHLLSFPRHLPYTTETGCQHHTHTHTPAFIPLIDTFPCLSHSLCLTLLFCFCLSLSPLDCLTLGLSLLFLPSLSRSLQFLFWVSICLFFLLLLLSLSLSFFSVSVLLRLSHLLSLSLAPFLLAFSSLFREPRKLFPEPSSD